MNLKVDFFGEKLRIARLLNGFTQQELGEYVSVSRQFIHQMEGGIKSPAEDVLDALCEVLKVRSSFFDTPLGNDVKFEQCHFRKRRTTPVGLANRVLAFSTIFEQLVALVNELLELPENRIPSVEPAGVNYTNEEIELAAEKCRKEWDIGILAPISKITRLLESVGVLITQFDGVSDKVDALSLNRKHPIIVRNNAKESICRMRFDLAHECGHFVLHDGIETGNKITESEADRFASAFIFPRSAFIKEFPDLTNKSRLDWDSIYKLKLRWGMSARALIYRAHKLERITSRQYRSANVSLNKAGYTRKEPFDDQVSKEKPELLESIFEVMRDDLGISFSAVSRKLGITDEMLQHITGIYTKKERHLENVVSIGM